MSSPAIVALVSDLMFLSRIREAARAAGRDVATPRTADALREAIGEQAGSLVVLDLDRPPFDPADVVAAAGGTTVIGFFSHVDEERGRRAREQGIRTMSRGAFVRQLPSLLAGG